MKPLELDFYLRDDVVKIAKELIGKKLFTCIDGFLCGGTIIETEAYKGVEDKACHAYGRRMTPRTAPLYERGGITYVYLCYGMHHLLNVVTNLKEIPHAVLIRAIEPLEGVETMLKRRKKNKIEKTLTNGPGTVCQALGIDLKQNGIPLFGKTIWIEDGMAPLHILATPRIGVDYAGEDAFLPWRFIAA